MAKDKHRRSVLKTLVAEAEVEAVLMRRVRAAQAEIDDALDIILNVRLGQMA